LSHFRLAKELFNNITSPLQMPGAVKGLSAVGVLIMIDRGIRADGQELMAGSLLVCALWSILLM